MMASKMSPTPCVQEDKLVESGWLSSKTCRYKVQAILGEGTFGKVAKCTRIHDSKTVAIKMLKKMTNQAEQANAEVAILEKMKSLNMDKCNIVQWYQVFNNNGYICLEFELLDKSLFDFMKERFFRPLFLREIRPIIQQLANALEHLKSIRLIHADLKLENVMLVNHTQQPYRVKVIDFGLACEVSKAKVCSCVQSRPYRSPEVMLGLPFTEAIDMWSLGCIAAALYIGTLLYPGNSSYDVMRCIVETQGQPPDHLLTRGYNTTRFFQRSHECASSLWKLKTQEQVYEDTKIQSQDIRRLKLTSLDSILHLRFIKTDNYADKAAEMADTLMFVDMLKGMLHLDAAKRITPRQVLDHPFIRMRHIDSMYSLSNHVRSCFEMMEAFRNKTGKSMCPSPRQPHCSTAGLVQHRISQHPCTSKQTTRSDRSGTKRKVDDEDVNKTSHQSKNIKSAFEDSKHRYADSTKTRLTKSPQSQSRITSSHKRRMADDECKISYSSNQTTRADRSGTKRKVDDEDEDVNKTSHQSKNIKSAFDNSKHRYADSTKTRLTKSPQSQSRTTSSHKRKMADDETRHYERSDCERKRFREALIHSRTSSCSRKTCVSPRVKRKLAQDEDSERSNNREKMAQIQHAGRFSHRSSHYSAPYRVYGRPHKHQRPITPPCSTHTKSQAQSNLQRKTPDEDLQSRKRDVFSGGQEKELKAQS